MAKRNLYKELRPCNKAVILSRVSSDEQKKGDSLKTQEKVVREYCAKQGLIVIKSFELSESSTQGDREEFWQIVDFVKNQKEKTALAVYSVDRLLRSFDDRAKLKKMVKDDLLEIHFNNENIQLTAKSKTNDYMILNINIFTAESAVNIQSEKIAEVMETNISEGKVQGKTVIGYKNIRDIDGKAQIMLDEERAPIIKKFFELYATGNYSLNILENLAKEYDLCSYRSRTKRPITRSRIAEILKNPFYYGKRHYKDKLIGHVYPKLISKELFDQVQECFEDKSKLYQKGGYREKQYALRGLIRCACGCLMTPEYHNKNGTEYVLLRCSKRKDECSQALVNQEIVFKQLDDEIFNQISISQPIAELLKRSVKKTLEEEINQNTIQKRIISTKLGEFQKKEEQLLDLLINSTINKEMFDKKRAQIEQEKLDLQYKLENCVTISKNIQETVAGVIDLVMSLPDFMKSDNVEYKGEILRLLLEDCRLEGKTLKYTIKKPFDKILNLTNQKRALKIEVENLKDFEAVSHNVKTLTTKLV